MGLVICYDLCFLLYVWVLVDWGVGLIVYFSVFIVIIGVVYWVLLLCVCVV